MVVLALFDRSIVDVLDSPYIIPVAGCLTGLGIVLGGIYSGIRTREIQSRERLALIASGRPVPPSPEELALAQGSVRTRRNDGRGARRAGIVLVSTALGLMAFFFALTIILRNGTVMCGAAVGLIPLLMGAGFLVDARLNAREAAREADEAV